MLNEQTEYAKQTKILRKYLLPNVLLCGTLVVSVVLHESLTSFFKFSCCFNED